MHPQALMAESVDALVSNTSGAIRAGSTPAQGTGGAATAAPLYFLSSQTRRACLHGTSGAIRAGSTPAQGTGGAATAAPFFFCACVCAIFLLT